MAQLRSGLGVFVLLGGLLFVTPPAAAQTPDPDERAVEGHRLSVDLVKRATAANLAMKKAETAAPESETSVDDDRTGDSLVDEMAKVIESTAWRAAALKTARITVRDYVLTTLVLGWAETAIETKATGTPAEPMPPWLVRNIAFVKAHPKEIKAFADSFQ